MKNNLKAIAGGILFIACFAFIVWQLIVEPIDMIGRIASMFLFLAVLRIVSAWWNRKKYRAELERQIRDGLASGEIVVEFQDGSVARPGWSRPGETDEWASLSWPPEK
jgi:hypothetical protein